MSFVDTSESPLVKLRSLRLPLPALLGAGLLVALCAGVLVGGLFDQEAAFVAPTSTEEEQVAEGEEAAEEEITEDGATDSTAEASVVTATPAEMVVHVAGAVVSPGIYTLYEGARVQDAVDAAGGFASDAEPDAVNLARTVQDGEQVLIPTVQEVEDGTYVDSSANTSSTSSSTSTGTASSSLVNINTAGLEELDTLPGVGPSTAQAIIDEREANGPFTSIEDIQRVSGIGEKKFEKLKDSICV